MLSFNPKFQTKTSKITPATALIIDCVFWESLETKNLGTISSTTNRNINKYSFMVLLIDCGFQLQLTVNCMWRSGLRENILSTQHEVDACEKLPNLHRTRSDIYKMLPAVSTLF